MPTPGEKSTNQLLKEARAEVRTTRPMKKNMTKADRLRQAAQNHLEMSQSTGRSGLGNFNQNKIGHSQAFIKRTREANQADADDKVEVAVLAGDQDARLDAQRKNQSTDSNQ